MTNSSYMNNRVLKLNVGFLLASNSGITHDSQLDLPRVRVADDLTLNWVRGPVRLSRTKEGVLFQALLKMGLDVECVRCLDQAEREVSVDFEELYAYQSGAPAEFRIHDDAIMDLNPLIRAEVIIEETHGFLCREDCQGLCSECGANLNRETCSCDRDNIDPRLAVLKKLLDSTN